jgi:hypothetical protein
MYLFVALANKTRGMPFVEVMFLLLCHLEYATLTLNEFYETWWEHYEICLKHLLTSLRIDETWTKCD